jgi:PAS domain S-box-containing protein
VNENAERLFKLERDELLRRDPGEMSPALQPDGMPSAEAVAERVRLALEGETPIFEWTHLDAEGQPFPCEIRLVRLPSSTRKLVRGSLTDISERKLLEAELRQSQKMDAIGQLAGGIAHDFNNLLTAILGNAEVALEELGPGTPVSLQLAEIREAGERAAALTRQLLAFSRKEIVHARVLNINAIVENLSRMLGRLIGEHVDLVTDLDPRLRSIRADPGQIEQLILNLALNARDAMPQGGTLTIRTRACGTCASPSAGQAHLGSAPCVLLEIADTGTGVAPDLREKIFEPFFTTKGPGKGTGLGLSTVYGVVKQNGADVWVDSHKGPGATFKICWPSCEEDAEDGTDTPRETRSGSETILVVEDEPAVLEVARKALADYGYNVLEATNGAEAMRVSDGHDGTIDLLVTDIVMPAVDGPDLARRISTTRPQTRILFVSGYSSELSNPDASRIEGEFLAKPYTPRELATVVRQILDG